MSACDSACWGDGDWEGMAGDDVDVGAPQRPFRQERSVETSISPVWDCRAGSRAGAWGVAVEVQMAQGEQAATTAFRAPSARRGVHPPSCVSAPAFTLLHTQPAHISVPPHPRALVQAPASTLTTSPAPPAGSISSFTLSCSAASSEETSLTPPHTHSLLAQDPLIPLTYACLPGTCGL